MMLCRVILGNMELLYPGSQQSYPSSEKFDSGVDDLENPSHYIIWHMNVNTHIYPEYVVSFRMPPVKGTFVLKSVLSQSPSFFITQNWNCLIIF